MSTNEPTETTTTVTTGPSRRQVLCGLAIALLAPAGLAACSDDSDGDASTSTPDGASPTNGGATTTPAETATEPGGALASVADVPIGGGLLVDGPDGQLLLVQPTEGTVKAYDPTCTHQGTTVNPPSDGGTIICPNHGSQYDPADGSVVKSPAERPLREVPVTVDGDAIMLA